MHPLGERGLNPSRVLVIGAHSDDIEIGCAATLLTLCEHYPEMSLTWVVLSADGDRESEARDSAENLVGAKMLSRIAVEHFPERFFPYERGLKEYFDALGRSEDPDLVLVPWRGDAHQDHRATAEHAVATFRDQLVLEYEIPKYDGDIGRPSVYVRLPSRIVDAKLTHLHRSFPSQRSRDWFSDETFRGLMRMRGIECHAPDGYAEAFHATKLVLL